MRRLPVTSFVLDQTAPRWEPSPIAATDPLLVSMKTLGVLSPLVVVRTQRHRYRILSGARRYHRAVRLHLTTLPCQVHAHLSPRRAAELRLALQTTVAPWTPHEAQRAKDGVEATRPGGMIAIPQPATAMLRRLPEAYRVEFDRMRPKLRPLGSHSSAIFSRA